jgi:hypothetical protein
VKKRGYKQDRAEIEGHLQEQAEFLRASAARFDAGYQSEAKRLATHLRTLLHDTPYSKSLLSQMGSDFRWRLADSALTPYNRESLGIYHGLAAVRLEKTAEGGSAAFVSLVASGLGDDHYLTRPFLEWWTSPVIRDAEGVVFGRKQIVLAVADQDGGAHVDPELDKAYAKLTRQNSLGLVFSVGDEPREWANNPVPPSIRQVTQEILWTLRDQSLSAGI